MSIKIDDYLKRIKLPTAKSDQKNELATPDIDIEKAKEGYQKYLSDSSKDDKNIFEKALDSATDWAREKFSVAILGNGFGKWFSNTLDKEAERNQNPDKPNDLWSEDQKNLFGYKYLSSPEDAYRYAVEVNNSITQQRNEKLAEEIGKDAASNFGTAALHTVNSIVTAPLSLVEYVDQLGATAKYGTPITRPLYASPTLLSEAAKSGIASNLNEYGTIDESVPILGGKGWGDAYGLGTSIAQSAYSGVLGGGSVLGSSYTLATYFGQSATLGIEDALSRGANGKQALAYGTVAGLAEAIPEMISAKSLIGITKAEGVQNVFKAVLKQAGEEATEEFTTSVLTEVADRWIMGGKSQYALTVQELMASGLSQEEAENKALTMTLENIAFDVISGAASGGISGAGAAGVNNINQRYFQGEKNARAKTELTPKQNELIAEGKKHEQTAKRSASLEKKLAKGKELSGYDLRMLATEVANTQRASDIEVLRKAIVDRMKSEGVSDSQAKRLGEIALKKALGNEKLSALEEGMLKRNEKAFTIYNEINNQLNKNVLQSTKENGIIKSNETDGVNEYENENGVRLRDGGERLGGTNSEGQISGVESRSGQAEIRRKTARIADSEAARLFDEGREVKVSDLGVPGGSAKQTVRVVDKSKETTSMKKARKEAEARGLNVNFFVGDNLRIVDESGKQISARAYIKGNEVYVRADHSLYTAEQLMRHELGHDIIAKGEVDIKAVRDKLLKKVGKENIDKIAELYNDAYAGTGMTAEEIWEECICDSLGEMNIFADEKISRKLLKKTLPKISKATKQSKTPIQTRGSPEGKASRYPYWYPDLSQQEWNLLNRKLDQELQSTDNYIDKNTKWLYADSRGTQVFCIYGIGNGTEATVLYAVGGKSAQMLSSWRDKYESGIDKTKRNPYRRHIEHIGVEQNQNVNSVDRNGKNNITRKRKSVDGVAQLPSDSQWGDNGGTVLSDSKQNNKVKSSGKASRELDTTYLDAVNRGDMGTAQRLVDEAAKANGYDKLFYHGAKKGGGFTEFRDWSYFTANKQYAERYTERDNKDSLYTTYVKLENPFDTRNPDVRDIFDKIRQEYGLSEIQDTGLPDWTDGYDISDYIDENELDYDGIILDEGGDLVDGMPVSRGVSYVIRKSAQIKSADPVTYDDEGNVIPLSERFKTDKSDIRYSRETVTSGQYAQMKANLSHGKVYSKASAMALVSKLAPGIRNRSFEDLSNKLWEGLNTYTSLEDKAAFASDMSEMFIDRMMVDTLTPNPEWDEASEKLSYLKPAITSINFTDAERTEIRHILDKDGLSRILGRWGYKSSGADTKRRYDLDVFITDISREMPGMEHLADMHPVDALMEIDKLYSDLSEVIKQKYESAYKDFSDEEINEIKRSIATDIMKAYQELGEQTKISKYLEEKLEYYQSRVDYWKAENAKTKAIARWNGILSTKAQQIRDLKKGAFYNATQYLQGDVFKNSVEELAKIQWRGNIYPKRVREIFEKLKPWYTKDNPMLYNKDNTDNLYSEAIAAYIEKISATEKDEFDENTHAMVYDVMNHLYTMMRNYNKVFRAGRWEDAPTLVDHYRKIMEKTARDRGPAQRIQERYATEFLEPMAIARRADGYNPDGFFTQTMQDLRRASIDASVGEMNLRKDYDAFIDNNKKYLANAAKDTVNYRGFDIPKLHLIGLYMTMKRKHARAGLARNGFEYAVKNKWWDSEDYVKVPGYVPLGDNVTQKMIDDATDEQMRVIESSLTDTDKEYIRILEKLFNEDLKALKIERDMERQGYTNATLDYYYPIMRGAIAENVDTAKISDQNRATNASFNKNTVAGSQQYLVIISADSMVNRHITDMCKYYYMSQAIENYNVLYNCDISDNANNPVNIAKIVKENKIWEKDVEYFKKLVADMQGIRDPQTTFERYIEGARGAYAKFALGANLKVLFTQFSSMIAAGDIISYKNILSPKALKISSADVDKYCPLAGVRNYDKTILRAMTLTDKFGKLSEAFTFGISKVDRFVITRLFASCQLEAQAKGLGALGTEENKIAAGKLLEEVIIETQQNSFATERSQAMRSKHELLKAITMFTADGMKIVGRMYDAFGELSAAKKSGDESRIKSAKNKVIRSVAVAASIAVFMSSIAVMFNWIYDRDEDEDENKLLSFTLDTVGNFIGALPFISDLYDYCVNGFEVESVAFDTLNNILGSINNIRKDLTSIVMGDGERSAQDIARDLRTMIYGVGQATGLPFRNIYNLARGIIGNFSSSAGYKIDSVFYESSLAGDLEKAIKNGDNSKISYIMALIYDERVNKSVSKSQIDEIVRLLKSEYESNPNDYNLSQKVLPKDLPDEIKRDGVEYVLTAEQKDVFSEVYSGVTDKIDNLISSTFYLSGDDERKSYLIDYYHDKYYDMAVNEALNLEDTKKTVYDLVGFEKYAEFAYSIKDIESDKDKNGNTVSGSKKKKVIAKINSLGISSEKKLLLIAYSGYKLDSETDKAKLLRYLNRSTMTVEEKKALAKKLKLQYKNGKFY